jgi:hypothetical protein
MLSVLFYAQRASDSPLQPVVGSSDFEKPLGEAQYLTSLSGRLLGSADLPCARSFAWATSNARTSAFLICVVASDIRAKPKRRRAAAPAADSPRFRVRVAYTLRAIFPFVGRSRVYLGGELEKGLRERQQRRYSSGSAKKEEVRRGP